MRRIAIAVAVLAIMSIAGCKKPTIDQVTYNLLMSLAKSYLGSNFRDFAQGMEARGWSVPERPEDWERWAKDFAYCLRWVAEHGGAPPAPSRVRTLGVDRSPVEAFGGVGP